MRTKQQARPHKPKSGRMIRAGYGPGWALWVPAAVWETMPESERAAMVARQATLLNSPISKSNEG